MSLLRDVIVGTIGYTIGNSVEHSTAINTLIDRNFGNKSLEEIIDDYAKMCILKIIDWQKCYMISQDDMKSIITMKFTVN